MDDEHKQGVRIIYERWLVYCKDGGRRGVYEVTQFDFIGYTFRRRKARNTKMNTIFIKFSPLDRKML